MRYQVTLEYVGTIATIADRLDLVLVTDSQDSASIRDHLGLEPDSVDSFFVKVEDGDYTEVYGFDGIVPGLGKNLYRINRRWRPESEPHYCDQCGKDVGNQWLLGPVCGKCWRENHRKVMGGK